MAKIEATDIRPAEPTAVLLWRRLLADETDRIVVDLVLGRVEISIKIAVAGPLELATELAVFPVQG